MGKPWSFLYASFLVANGKYLRDEKNFERNHDEALRQTVENTTKTYIASITL